VWIKFGTLNITAIRIEPSGEERVKKIYDSSTWVKMFINRGRSKWDWGGKVYGGTPFVTVPKPGYYEFMLCGRSSEYEESTVVICKGDATEAHKMQPIVLSSSTT